MKKECPICGSMALVEKTGEFHFKPPANIPGGMIIIANSIWEECEICHEVILPPDLIERLEKERYIRLGLLSPAEIKAIRVKAGLSQAGISEILGVGEKTYTRWENGKSLQNKSSDNLIRLFSKDPSYFEDLETQRESDGSDSLMGYLSNRVQRNSWKGKTSLEPDKNKNIAKGKQYLSAA